MKIDLNSNCTTTYKQWGDPIHLATHVYEDRIEIDYKAEANSWFGVFYHSPSPKIWKEIWRAVGGELVKETKEGQYHSPQGEYYTFD